MPQTYIEKREEARKMYVESGGQTFIKDIAEKLDVPRPTVSHWKKVDAWDKGLKKKPKPHANSGPKGNRNAAGKGQSKKGNQNNFRHGRYAQIKYDTMTDEEKAIIAEIQEAATTSQMQMQINLIGELEVRERRMYALIAALRQEMGKAPGGLIDDYAQTTQKGVTPSDQATGKIRPMDIVKGRKRASDKIQEIEMALTGVQKQKQAALSALHKLTEDQLTRSVERERLDMEKKRLELMERRLSLMDPDSESDSMKEARAILGEIDSAF